MASDAKAISSKPEYSVAIHNLVLKRKAGKGIHVPRGQRSSGGNLFWQCDSHYILGRQKILHWTFCNGCVQ